ncbi:glycine betaine/L-proline ABC transporter ATP-binding protein [Cryobacterium melibiosiphilum]|uniref:Glycine betaine/L-proline ABC transporter ATP-binding protein n=1 Tax=Cryobacterium melibiosiphilum TaxID=995039 RepID=A0A3A5MLB1_9MICO|nr:glycine betaine/L-proline ABC transporter ATP-binding protein [Cryobacterium melibiosiphilum]RJT89761.1 glycine betaine/L-proline ABC transporter ATP-binding protein [Cryobacterium melibiosiphilum]
MTDQLPATLVATAPRDSPPDERPLAIDVSNVYKVFGKRPQEVVQHLKTGRDRDDLLGLGTAAVIDVSFNVQKGEIFVVMGLSGSGKSTLIRMLNGLNPASEGSIMVLGEEVVGCSATELRERRRDKMSMVFQHFALLPHRTVVDNVAYGLESQGLPAVERQERARHWLDRVGLGEWADSLPGQLSGGMKQRVGIARAFAADTEILLMDEAFSALDPLIRREMQELLIELQGELGKTIVFITHDLNEAMFLGDRIAVMRNGRIVQVGTPNRILTDPANDYVAQFVQDVDRARILTAGDVMEPARSVVRATAGPRTALDTMRRLQVSACYVTDDRHRLLGIVRDKDMMRLVREEGTDLTERMCPVPSIVKPNQLMANLFEMVVESSLPIAVTDDDDRLLGVVPRVTLLASLANLPPATSAISIVKPPGNPASGEKGAF